MSDQNEDDEMQARNESRKLDRQKLMGWAGVWADIAEEIEKRVTDPTLRELAFRATARAAFRDPL